MAVRRVNHYSKQVVNNNNINNNNNNIIKKVSPLQAMKGHWRCRCKVSHIYTATALGRGGVASPTLGRFYPGKAPPRNSFCRRLSEPQDQSVLELRKGERNTSNYIDIEGKEKRKEGRNGGRKELKYS